MYINVYFFIIFSNTGDFKYTKYLYMKKQSTLCYPSNINKGTCNYYQHCNPFENNVWIDMYIKITDIINCRSCKKISRIRQYIL